MSVDEDVNLLFSEYILNDGFDDKVSPCLSGTVWFLTICCPLLITEMLVSLISSAISCPFHTPFPSAILHPQVTTNLVIRTQERLYRRIWGLKHQPAHVVMQVWTV